MAGDASIGRRAGPALAALLLTVAAAMPAVADDEPERAIVRLTVNDVSHGDVAAVMSHGDVFLRAADLDRAGIGGLGRQRRSIGGEIYVSLRSLAPESAWSFDEPNLAVKVVTRPTANGLTIQDLEPGRPAGLVYSQDTAAFLNTSLTAIDFDRVAWNGEAGISVRNMLLWSTASLDAQGTLARGLTSFTLDDRSRMVRYLAGDRFDTTGVLGGAAQLGGLSISRDFSLDPYFIRFPTVGLSGAVLSRSTAEVYVNGQLVRREEIPAGSFELRNLPVPIGTGTAQVLLRDAFGRVEVITSPFYFTSAVLKEGVSAWSYNLGFRRDLSAAGLGQYGPLNLLARHRIGVTDNVTAGYRLEAGTDLVSGGPTLTLRLPVGDVELAGAGSYGQGDSGWAASLAYNFASPWISVGVAAQTMSDQYTNVSLKVAADRPRLSLLALASFPVTSRGTVTLGYSRADYRDMGTREQISVSASVRLSNRISVFATASRSEQRGLPGALDAFCGLTYFLGDATTATVSHNYTRQDNGAAQHRSVADVQRSLPLGPGWGYRVQANRAEQQTPSTPDGPAASSSSQYGGLALVQYQGRYGFYEASHQQTGSRGSTVLTAAASLVAIGGGLHVGRPVQAAFALVQVPGVAGVRGLLNNQEMGWTDADGDLLVPNLLSYFGNRVGIGEADLPIEYTLGTSERLVGPPFRGGAVVTFPAARVQGLVSRVVVERQGRSAVPAYGELTLTAGGQAYRSPIGRDGEIYLENVPPGRHPATVEYQHTVCQLVLEVPATTLSLVELDPIRCLMP